MSFWWLRPGWGNAACCKCGCNIKRAGGDPDMGICPDCFEYEREQIRAYEEEQIKEYEKQACLAQGAAAEPEIENE